MYISSAEELVRFNYVMLNDDFLSSKIDYSAPILSL